MASGKNQALPKVEVGVLGGTGLYEIEGLTEIEEVALETPFGKPSDAYLLGILEGKKIAFLNRHGRGHRFLPFEINYRANIFGFKMLGAERLISVNSVGSLKEEIKPRDIVISDQFFDRTKRLNSFFGEGIAAHIGLATPVCPELSGILFEAGNKLGVRVHKGGTYICIEGPSFSTKAESNIYRLWGCAVIGMTSATEAKLAREAEICYSALNLVTDYDVWHESEEPVSIEIILEVMRENIHNAKAIIKKAIKVLSSETGRKCECSSALKNCIITPSELIPQEVKQRLSLIISKYIDVT